MSVNYRLAMQHVARVQRLIERYGPQIATDAVLVDHCEWELDRAIELLTRERPKA